MVALYLERERGQVCVTKLFVFVFLFQMQELFCVYVSAHLVLRVFPTD